MLRITLGIITIGLAGAVLSGSLPIEAVGRGPSDECDRARLGTALVLDTVTLEKSSRSGPSTQAAEGGLVVVWSDSASPRIVKLSYFGETGRRTTEYYLVDRRNFVILSEEILYASPLVPGVSPVTRARIPSVAYVCDGKPDFQGDTLSATALAQDLEAVITGRPDP